MSAKSKDLKDIIDQLTDEIRVLKGIKKQEFQIDKDTDYALGISIRNGQYEVVKIAYNLENGLGQVVETTQAKNSKNYHTVKLHLQDKLHEVIIKNLKVIEA